MEPRTYVIKPGTSSKRLKFYDRLDRLNLAPLWEVRVFKPEPDTRVVPAVWTYNQVRPLVQEAAEQGAARDAQRRLLILENPGLEDTAQTTQSLSAGLQFVLSGETTPSHRHATSSIRFVMEGQNAYSVIDGERTTMNPGDVVLTPSWSFHEHGNPGEDPMVWLDVLDAPIVNTFDASFHQSYRGGSQPLTPHEGNARMRYGQNMHPVGFKPDRPSSPVPTYPYSQTRASLEQVCRNGPVNPYHGVKMQYANPATGGYPLPTMACFLQFLPSGFHGKAYRATDASIYCVAEGRGRSRICGKTFSWSEHDVFVVPSWGPVHHESDSDAVLFSVSDRPAQKAISVWREERLDSE